MDPARLLIVGANGQVGRALQQAYPEATAVGHDQLDITDWDTLAAYDWSGYDAILNAAAYTKVDEAETPEGRVQAWLVNATATGYLSTIASEHNLTLVHLSTDYVFDGAHDNHLETEPFSPLGVYAASKAAGDIAASSAPRHYILRVSGVVGDGPNFVRTMISLAARDISPTVVADQIGRLTFTSTIVDAIAHCLHAKPAYGTYHLSNSGEPASWADITRAIFTQLNRGDLTVTDTTTAEYFAGKPQAAPRPLLSTMNLGKIQDTGLDIRDWRDDLTAYIAAEQAKPKE